MGPKNMPLLAIMIVPGVVLLAGGAGMFPGIGRFGVGRSVPIVLELASWRAAVGKPHAPSYRLVMNADLDYEQEAREGSYTDVDRLDLRAAVDRLPLPAGDSVATAPRSAAHRTAETA